MTPRDPTNRQPAARKRTVLLYGLDGVGGTAWIITARGREQWRKPQLVTTYEKKQNSLHGCTIFFESPEAISEISVASAPKLAPYPEDSARITTSIPLIIGINFVRASSRSLLRSRFRSTIV